MKIKQIIDWRKILLFFILIIITSVIKNFGFGIWWSGTDIGANYGFPFGFYGYGGGPPLMEGQAIPSYFDIVSLVLDLIIWFIVSYLIIWIYDKVKKKK